jgi:hypothetical protein
MGIETPMGKAMAHMAVVFAELERDFIRSRTREVQRVGWIAAGDSSSFATQVLRRSVDQRRSQRGMKRLVVVAVSAAVLAFAGGSAAFAGEVKGPPGIPDNTNETGALAQANSGCAASGLNDLDSAEGQNVSQVQTAADSWKYYGLPKGSPGTLGLCRGGTGER